MVLGDWQVRNARRRPVRATVVDAPTVTEVGVSQGDGNLLSHALAVRCRESISTSTQVSAVFFPVGIRSCHFQQCGRMSLPYKSGHAMYRTSHQGQGPTGKALVYAEVTRQDTEHNIVSPVPQPGKAF